MRHGKLVPFLSSSFFDCRPREGEGSEISCVKKDGSRVGLAAVGLRPRQVRQVQVERQGQPGGLRRGLWPRQEGDPQAAAGGAGAGGVRGEAFLCQGMAMIQHCTLAVVCTVQRVERWDHTFLDGRQVLKREGPLLWLMSSWFQNILFPLYCSFCFLL